MQMNKRMVSRLLGDCQLLQLLPERNRHNVLVPLSLTAKGHVKELVVFMHVSAVQ